MSHVTSLREQCLQTISGYQNRLDAAIAASSRAHFEALKSHDNLAYDLRRATDEAWALSEGQDLRYDRLTTGLLYALWYHPQRITTCLPQVLDSLLESDPTYDIEVYDLGAGTGAFQWSFALAAAAIKYHDPARDFRLHLVNIDSSAIMLNELARLWGAFAKTLPSVARHVTHEVSLNSYTKAAAASTARRWVTASYLFDHSDKAEAVTADFKSIVASFEPDRILLSTSSQKGTKLFPTLSAALTEDTGDTWAPLSTKPHRDTFHGALAQVNRLREEIGAYAGYPDRIRPNARWRSTYHKTLTLVAKRTPTLVAAPVDIEIDMFRPELPTRTKLVLSPEQEAACRPYAGAIAVFGPAGSGKSVILSERIKRLVEERDYDFDLRILVTTFNKKLVTDVLCKWMWELLDPARIYVSNPNDGSASIGFKGADGKKSGVANIQLYNFDKLPTRLGRVHKGEFSDRKLFGDYFDGGYEAEQDDFIESAIAEVKGRLREDFDTNYSSVKHVLNAQYIDEDLHRIVYGRGCEDRKTFLEGSRPGRTLISNSVPRRVLWAAIETYVKRCAVEKKDSYLSRRVRLRRFLDAGNHRNLYTHIFVDELQDCGNADFRIFYSLLRDPNNLCVTGDLAQAVHLGKSSGSSLPRYNHFYDKGHPNDVITEQSNWRYVTFEGSYRLPFRISEALIPLSEAIAEKRTTSGCDDAVGVVLQYPYKGSPPGARILIVAASTAAEMAHKICQLHRVYGQYGDQLGVSTAGGAVVMERDEDFCKALNNEGVKATTDTILRLKGLEYSFVIWSSRGIITAQDDYLEYVYTILTRTSGLAVIALFPDVCEEAHSVLNTFDLDQVICWDQMSEQALQRSVYSAVATKL